MPRKTEIEAVLQRHRRRLESHGDVAMLGISGSSEAPVILVGLKRRSPRLEASLRQGLDGFAVKVEVTGELTPFPTSSP